MIESLLRVIWARFQATDDPVTNLQRLTISRGWGESHHGFSDTENSALSGIHNVGAMM